LNVNAWNSDARIFEAVPYDVMCNLDPNSRNECEVFVKAAIPPMSYQIFRLAYDLSPKTIDPVGYDFLASEHNDKPIRPPRNTSTNIHYHVETSKMSND